LDGYCSYEHAAASCEQGRGGKFGERRRRECGRYVRFRCVGFSPIRFSRDKFRRFKFRSVGSPRFKFKFHSVGIRRFNFFNFGFRNEQFAGNEYLGKLLAVSKQMPNDQLIVPGHLLSEL
jgi:hypothetical protein